MKILMQLAIIFTICLFGEAIAALLPFAFPASVLSMVLVFLLLLSGQLKIYHIKKQTDFLLDHMAFFFIPAAVSLTENLHYLQGKILLICLVCFITTITTFFCTAYAVKTTMHLEAKWKGRRHQ